MWGIFEQWAGQGSFPNLGDFAIPQGLRGAVCILKKGKQTFAPPKRPESPALSRPVVYLYIAEGCAIYIRPNTSPVLKTPSTDPYHNPTSVYIPATANSTFVLLKYIQTPIVKQ